jgi:hypothetical protein
MNRPRLLLALGGLLLLYTRFDRDRYVTAKPYDVDEAYKVYSAILPSIGKSPLVISTETRTREICLRPLNNNLGKLVSQNELVGGNRE